MTTILMNHSILDNEDLATMAFEAVDRNQMEGGLWAIQVDKYAMFDCTNMERVYDPSRHNAVVNVRTQKPCVDEELPKEPKVCIGKFNDKTKPLWYPTQEEIDEYEQQN